MNLNDLLTTYEEKRSHKSYMNVVNHILNNATEKKTELRKRLFITMLDLKPMGLVENTTSSYYKQISLDTNRATNFDSPPKVLCEKEKLNLKVILESLLFYSPECHYYQGLHAIVSLLKLVFPEDTKTDNEYVLSALYKLTKHHLKWCCLESFDVVQSVLLLIPCILEKFNESLAKFVLMADPPCIFPMSWILTLFGYIMSNEDDAYRVFEFLVFSHPIAGIYLTCSYLLKEKDLILNMSTPEEIFNLSKNSSPVWEELIKDTVHYLKKYPINSLLANDITVKNACDDVFPFDYCPIFDELSIDNDENTDRSNSLNVLKKRSYIGIAIGIAICGGLLLFNME
eukprot:TRINITY_DN1513_c0_g1_i1.p1 TRINITY_DN1513_c0_g1~~TRINITY_DN1513_c0_g1_i1.p1  ORF type:complete len:352 (+),score=79.20 TRINITY_DN1513_c0_g1_i1:32-1057(+)